ncbi:MAG: DUF389 domain-containing protein [Gemmatimonadales bacterium]
MPSALHSGRYLMTLFQNLRSRLALHDGTDAPATIERISGEASLTAENLWMLGCSAVLASIGLDMGSATVVIGAMLISPLMGPILGVGLGVGVTDRYLLQRSLRELAFATVLVLLVSGTYFLLSPLATPTTELVARTKPTLLDVGVAFFGGIAGIVAGSRKRSSMAIPGVAIATALMPPLCTAGFGLATRNWVFFTNAFYLYVLNAVFIALSTFLIARLLRFPRHEEQTPEARMRERRMVAIVATIAVLPSVYFLYGAARDVRERARISSFIQNEIEAPGRAVPQWEHHHTRKDEVLRLYIAGRPIEGEAVDSVVARLPRYSLDGLRVELIQSDISADDLQRVRGEVQREVLRTMAVTSAARDSVGVSRQREDSTRLASAAREVARAFPEVTGFAFSSRGDLLTPDSVVSPPVVFLRFNGRTSLAQRREILTRSEGLLRERLGIPQIVVEIR